MRIELREPIEWEGQRIDVLDLALERLRARDLLAIGKKLRKVGERDVLQPETDDRYLLALAARAAKIDPDALEELSARDWVRVRVEVQGFLLGSDSGPEPSAS